MITSLFGRISYFSKKLIVHVTKKLTFADADADQKGDEGRWNQVSADVLQKIMQTLDVADRVRMKIVCKSWQSLIDQNLLIRSSTQVPWLMLPHSVKSNYFTFFDLCYGSIYNIKIPNSLQRGRWWCCGSSKGWLVILTEYPYFNPQVLLLNPISGVQIPLPPITTIPSVYTFLSHLKRPSKVRDFVIKIELSSTDASDCTVAGMFFRVDTLALCRPGDKSWTIFQGMDDKMYHCSNILFSNDQVLHVLTCDEQATFAVHTETMRVSDRHVILKIITHNIYLTEQVWIPEDESEIVWTKRESLAAPYLVESDGELLIVHKVLNMMDVVIDDIDVDVDVDVGVVGGGGGGYNGGGGDDDGGDDDSGDDEDDVLDTCYVQTSRFELFKIGDLHSNTSTVTRLNSLGDQTLFVGLASSISINPARVSHIGLKKNCIFFVDDINDQNSRESGVYSFKDGSIKRSIPNIHSSIHNGRINWFSPNIQ